jgi:hypothetical protein
VLPASQASTSNHPASGIRGLFRTISLGLRKSTRDQFECPLIKRVLREVEECKGSGPVEGTDECLILDTNS